MRQAAALLTALLWTVTAAPADDIREARRYLSKTLTDARLCGLVLPPLRATGDRDLLAVFVAFSRSGDRKLRMFATSSLPEIGGTEAAAALHERLSKDPAMAIRVEALLRLVALKAISDKELIQALQIRDEGVQSVAARALVRRGRGAAAVEALRKLTTSTTLATSSMARLTLLEMGYGGHREALERVIADSGTSDSVLSLLMGQIERERIAPAKDLALQVARSTRPVLLRMNAYRAYCQVAPDGPEVLRRQIEKSQSVTVHAHLVRAICSAKEAPAHLAALGRRKDTAGSLARFELARPTGGETAAVALREVLAPGHPILVNYVLDRAREDADKNAEAAGFYVPALLRVVAETRQGAQTMGREHIRAAQAVTILADLSSPEALAGLRKLLGGRYGPTTRVVAGGLMRTRSRRACDLARPLLKSPYEELAVDAALILGKFSDAQAAPHLGQIVRRARSHRPQVVVLAGWYLLKMSGQGKAAAEELARKIR